MLRPIVGFCLSRGVRIQDFIEISKGSFVEAAAKGLQLKDGRISCSRISAMTGIQRPEVNRLLSQRQRMEPRDVVTRIIGQWADDKRFRDNKGKPRPLSFSGKASQFNRLVRLVSSDLNPHTVRFELERLGLIEVIGSSLILKEISYISQGDPKQALQFASEDVADLMTAVQENALLSANTPNLHARTQYDNIPDDDIPKIKKALLDLGRRFHVQARALLAPFDNDINPRTPRRQGRNRVVVGTFSRVHEFVDESDKTEGEML